MPAEEEQAFQCERLLAGLVPGLKLKSGLGRGRVSFRPNFPQSAVFFARRHQEFPSPPGLVFGLPLPGGQAPPLLAEPNLLEALSIAPQIVAGNLHPVFPVEHPLNHPLVAFRVPPVRPKTAPLQVAAIPVRRASRHYSYYGQKADHHEKQHPSPKYSTRIEGREGHGRTSHDFSAVRDTLIKSIH